MAEEKKGFFGRLFGGGATETDKPGVYKRPTSNAPMQDEAREIKTDIPVQKTQAADPDQHEVAAATTSADAEAGADVKAGDDSGGIEPLERLRRPEETPPADSSDVPDDAILWSSLSLARPAETAAPGGWFQRLRSGLSRSSSAISTGIGGLNKRLLDQETLEDLEDILVQADLGVETSSRIAEELSQERFNREVTADDVRAVLAREVEKSLAPVAKPLIIPRGHSPFIILMVGVNGTGKTTTIGKLASKLSAAGLKVMLAAGDTFRAAAVEQLKIWGERTGSTVIAREIEIGRAHV